MFVYKFKPCLDHVTALGVRAAALPSLDEESDEEPIEMTVAKEPYGSPMLAVFKDGGSLGLRVEWDDDKGLAWFKPKGFTIHPVLVKYPIRSDELALVMLDVLTGYFEVSPNTELIVSEVDNPDEWPENIPLLPVA